MNIEILNKCNVRFTVLAVLIFVSVLSGCGGGSSDKVRKTVVPIVLDTLAETLDLSLTKGLANNEPGLSFLVRKDGNIVFQTSRGIADQKTETPIGMHTGFRLGSVSKPFTAIAIMQLVEKGLLSLEDKLNFYLPELSVTYQDITIHHLLTHQSGIPDFINDVVDVTVWDGVTTSQFISMNKNFSQLEFTPGSQGQYSNTGYVLLAVVVERRSGMKFPEYMDANIFVPLGMDNSYIINELHQPGEFGAEFALNDAKTTKVLKFSSLIYGPGGVVSSTDDMARFIYGWLNNDLLSVETRSQMVQSFSAVSGIDYGYGWMTGGGTPSYKSNDYWHTGGFDHYQSLLYFSPDNNLEIVALSNGGKNTLDIFNDLVRLTRSFYSQQ